MNYLQNLMNSLFHRKKIECKEFMTSKLNKKKSGEVKCLDKNPQGNYVSKLLFVMRLFLGYFTILCQIEYTQYNIGLNFSVFTCEIRRVSPVIIMEIYAVKIIIPTFTFS